MNPPRAWLAVIVVTVLALGWNAYALVTAPTPFWRAVDAFDVMLLVYLLAFDVWRYHKARRMNR